MHDSRTYDSSLEPSFSLKLAFERTDVNFLEKKLSVERMSWE
jgi:hypothetical protein